MTAIENPPQTVLAFTDHVSPMEEAWPSTHRCMMPIAGRALISRLVEQLRDLGIRHLRIAGSIQQVAARQRLRQGDEWGMTIRYSDLHGPDLRLQTLAESGRCLYLHADALHDFNLDEIVETSEQVKARPDKRDNVSGYWTLDGGSAKFSAIDSVSSSPYQRNDIDSVSSFHEANLDAASGAWESLRAPGAAIGDRASLDWNSEIAHSAHIGDKVFVGRHCKISRRVQLHGKCVVGHGAVIMADAELYNVTVLPNCFIGPRVKLRDAVVTPLGLYDLNGGFHLFEDRTTFGRTRHNDAEQTGLPDEKLSETERRLTVR